MPETDEVRGQEQGFAEAVGVHALHDDVRAVLEKERPDHQLLLGLDEKAVKTGSVGDLPGRAVHA